MEMKREEFVYTHCYCEENIWKLSKKLLEEENWKKPIFVVFISNEKKKIPLFGKDGSHVVWDYHVIAISEDQGQHIVFDFDAKSLPFPATLLDYVKYVFQPHVKLKSDYERMYRILTTDEYFAHFSSDRSHMLDAEGKYLATPPSYPPIQIDSNPSCPLTSDIKTNLFSKFVEMKEKELGQVIDEEQLLRLFGIELRIE